MNPGCDESLSKLQSILVRMQRSGTSQKVYDNVQNEYGRKKFQTLDFALYTRWNSPHSETMCGTSNKYDIYLAISNINYEGGIGEELFLSNSENLDKIYPTSNDWVLWAHFDAVMTYMKQYSERS